MPETLTARDRAVALEQDAVRYPEERGEILLEAADQWKQAGEPDRAVALWHELIDAGGEDAGYARYGLVELYFEQGRDPEAHEHLKALEAGPVAGGPAGLVAELLAERGDDEAALRWFDRAIATLGEDDVAAIGEPGGSPSIHAPLFFGRQRCRRALGLPADDWDRVADVAERNRLEFVRLLERAAGAHGRRGPAEGTMLVWQRDEQQRAARRWPSVFTPDTIGNHPGLEQRLHQLTRESGLSKITLILGSVDGFAAYLDETGGDPDEEQVRLAYGERARAEGRHMSWPPGRNEPCWCGSARKYKKCCGVPQNSA
ncbi:SEC-C metal-binding domain-containing protein [Dactylosporangium sp. CA-092794]|uniref:SEC-C metal-binding domain-containing protein n=1 Tax=Dactylosporangium sp. CA-092794 TaxID=3239929 RepID=UPI003D8F3551